jgi:hypothetical protein
MGCKDKQRLEVGITDNQFGPSRRPPGKRFIDGRDLLWCSPSDRDGPTEPSAAGRGDTDLPLSRRLWQVSRKETFLVL